MPQPTVSRHLDLLEVSYLLVRLPAYAVNRTSRLIKAPKLYWNDTALALHLAGEDEPRGAHLENLVLGDLLAWSAGLVDAHPGDVLADRLRSRGRLRGRVERPSAARGGQDDRARARATRRPAGVPRRVRSHVRAGLLLHAGEAVSWLADGVLAAPWWSVI